MKNPRESKGVALITALLIVALATIAATSFATQQQLDIRRTGNLIDGDQAWTYAEAGETWAKLILRKDLANKKSQTDDLTELWAQPLPPINLPGGSMTGAIRDAQARLNLNNLVLADEDTGNGAPGDLNGTPGAPNGTGAPGTQVDQETLDCLKRLLAELQMNPNLADAIIDWMDRDINPRGSYGAEDDYYSRLKHPYRTANQPLVSVSELRLVKGITEKAYQRIAPFVTVLPTHTDVNVNTAPAEVLATLGNMDVKTAVALTKVRQGNPFKTPEDFQKALSAVGSVSGGQPPENIDVITQYFDVTVDTRIGFGRATLNSLLYRQAQGDIKTMRRAQGVL